MAESLDLLLEADIELFRQRLEKLHPESSPRWGKMSATQMLHHLNRALGCGLGLFQFEDKSNFVKRSFIKWIVLYVLKGFPKNSKTPRVLKVVDEYDFEEEKTHLLSTLDSITSASESFSWAPHPYFGNLTTSEWKRLAKLHVNYHFNQFGI